MRSTTLVAFLSLTGDHVLAQVFSSEFFSDPVSEGWTLFQENCEPETWIADGRYFQQLDFDGCPAPLGDQQVFRNDIVEFNGVPRWFYEFRVQASGDRSEIPFNAPTAISAFNSFGDNYKVNVARDQVKLYRDAVLPILFFDVDPGIPHTIRLELFNDVIPTYRWYIDGVLVDEGLSEDVFPSDNSRVQWVGRCWWLTTENTWYFFRYGIPATEHSGDYDSDSDIDSRDYFYFAECVAERGNGPGIPTDPGCEWADMDADGDVDFADFARFQRAFTGGDGE